MRSAILGGLIWAACGGREAPPPSPSPPPPKPAVAPDRDDPPPPPDDDIVADGKAGAHIQEREAGVPARTACAATCDLAADPRAKNECVQTAPGMLVTGFSEHLSCFATQVILDCCPPIDASKLDDVIAALGWKHANPDQRRAIGWLVVRAVRMQSTIETMPAEFPEPAKFTPPKAELAANRDVVLDYWTRSYLHPRFYHQQFVVHADGTSSSNDLGDLDATPDPALARQQAIEAAQRAGILGKKAGSGSGK